MSEEKQEWVKSCDECGKNYDEELQECPRCGCNKCWFWIRLKDNLFDEIPEDYTFSFSIDITLKED